jgi:hypothetical protein
VSFGLYLLHRPVMYFWRDLAGLHLHWTIMFVTVTATLLAASHLAYRWIEQPARRAIAPDRSAVPLKGDEGSEGSFGEAEEHSNSPHEGSLRVEGSSPQSRNDENSPVVTDPSSLAGEAMKHLKVKPVKP